MEDLGWEGHSLLKGERREEVKFHKVFEPRAWADSRFSEGRLVSCALESLAAIAKLLFSSSWLLPGSSTLMLRARMNSESPSRQLQLPSTSRSRQAAAALAEEDRIWWTAGSRMDWGWGLGFRNLNV